MIEYPFTIAYNIEEKKVGCVLLQTIMGATFPSGEVVCHFDTESWELNPSKCKLYNVRWKEEFDFLKKATEQARISEKD